jgi:hypothetical protein
MKYMPLFPLWFWKTVNRTTFLCFKKMSFTSTCRLLFRLIKLIHFITLLGKQAASEQKLQSLRHKVEKMEDLQSVQNGVLRTIAEEQEILRLICITRAAMQQSTAVSLQHLAKLEQFCGKTIQKALSLVDSGRTKVLHNSQQVQHSFGPVGILVAEYA